MDLFSLIIIIFAGFIIKYLTDIIGSLTNEIREIKTKCIRSSSTENFTYTTKNPTDKMSYDLMNNITYLKKIFG